MLHSIKGRLSEIFWCFFLIIPVIIFNFLPRLLGWCCGASRDGSKGSMHSVIEFDNASTFGTVRSIDQAPSALFEISVIANANSAEESHARTVNCAQL